MPSVKYVINNEVQLLEKIEYCSFPAITMWEQMFVKHWLFLSILNPSDTSNMILEPAIVPHTCNPNTSGGWNRMTRALGHPRLYNKVPFQKLQWDPVSKTNQPTNQPMRGQWGGPVSRWSVWLMTQIQSLELVCVRAEGKNQLHTCVLLPQW